MNDVQRKIYDEQTDKLMSSSIIDSETRNSLDSLFNDVTTLFQTNIDELDTTARDQHFGTYKSLMENYGRTLSGVKYNVELTADEYKFVEDLVLHKAVLDRQDVFVAQRIVDELLVHGNVKRTATYAMTIEMVTWVSYVLGKQTVKGFGSHARNFIAVIETLASASRVFEVFNKKGEGLAEAGDNWLKALNTDLQEETPGMVEKATTPVVVAPEVVAPVVVAPEVVAPVVVVTPVVVTPEVPLA